MKQPTPIKIDGVDYWPEPWVSRLARDACFFGIVVGLCLGIIGCLLLWRPWL